MDRIFQQLIGRLLGRLMNRAVDSGISFIATRGKGSADLSEADHQQARAGQDLAKKARKMSRASRKLF
jgi:hypothetical protein